jgi:NAD(P)H-hydrate epimerase
MVHGVCSADVLQRLIHQADAVVIGPGLSQNEWSGLLFATLLGKQRKYVDKPMLVDADGLNLLAQREDRLEACRPKNWILTPHPGEAARLLHTTIEEVQSDRFAAATRLAQAYQANILIKGAGSIVCHSEGEMRLCDQGNPGMATAGMGDVLAGMVGALLCQGLEPFDALSAGVMLHAQAADRVALQGGERGMIASDLFSEIRIGVNPCR